jgi:hypothetical protein
MKPDSILFRQVHPNFFPNGKLSSQAFVPFPKDEGKLSVYDGDLVSAAESFVHYTEQLQFESVGVWGVANAEVGVTGLTSTPDPLPDSPAHALVDFGNASDKECRKLAKKLKAFANSRGCLHSPNSPE